MNNFEKWQSYTDRLMAPHNYVTWGWLSLISSCLQRRVWLGTDNQKCFANQYIFLVGPPATGKGLIIKEHSAILRHYKRDDFKANTDGYSKEDKAVIDAVVESDNTNAVNAEMGSTNKQQGKEVPLLFPVAPETVTFESLIETIAASYRRINFKTYDEKLGREKIGVYGHCSTAFSLRELASLMRKRTHDTINFLLDMWDCPEPYLYKTKTQGADCIRRGCLNMIAGTTPSFMRSAFDDKLTGEGFTSRVLFIYATKNRQEQFFIRGLTEDEKICYEDILKHVLKLSTLYGAINYDAETRAFLDDWALNYHNNSLNRGNKSPLMEPYYGRKKVHLQKAAMALHFGESTEMHIPLETFKRAIKIIEQEEKTMHLGITLESDNPEAKLAKNLLAFLETGPKNWVDIYATHHTLGNRRMIEETISFLVETNQCEMFSEKDETIDKNVQHWRLKR